MTNFYSFKSKGYNIQTQVIVDHRNIFQDVGILSFVNDDQILRMFSMYHKTIEHNLFIIELKQKSIKFYILRDKGYPLQSWLMVLHKQIGVCQIMLKVFYNGQISHGRSVVKNSFGILKKMFKELLQKTGLNILFLSNVVVYYYIT